MYSSWARHSDRFWARSYRVCVVLMLLACATVMQGQRKKRIAILSFETGSDERQTAQQLGVKDDLGLVLSNLLVNEIAGAGKVQVVERSALDQVLKEQNRTNSDRFDNTEAARIGKIAGVDAILIGSLAQFTGSSKETTGSKAFSVFNKNNAVHRVQTKVSIVISCRVIDVNTGVVMTTAQGEGAAENMEMQVASTAKTQEMGSPVLNEATMKAIKSVATQLDATPALTETVAVARTPYKGVVVDVDGNTLIFAVGSRGGAKIGDVVQVSRTGRVIKDKAGTVLKTLFESLGTAKITEVDEKTSTATFTGTKPVKVDDVINFAP